MTASSQPVSASLASSPPHRKEEAPESGAPLLPVPKDGRDGQARANFLPYPVSTLGPAIVPNDLSGFRAHGGAAAEKRLRQELVELRDRYAEAVDRYNWNQLVYRAEFSFEPVMGEVYHLYRSGGRFVLSMVAPEEWFMEHLGSFRLNADRAWEAVTLAEGLDVRDLFGS